MSGAASTHGAGVPSAFFRRGLEHWRALGGSGLALDLACGRGRHALAAARAGLRVLGIDRDREALQSLAAEARHEKLPVKLAQADIETSGIPLKPETCSAVFVFCFLYRPLCAEIERALAPGGLLLYETFTTAQRELGWGPRRDTFLLAPGELPGLFPGLEVLAFEEGPSADPRPAATARLAARKPQR